MGNTPQKIGALLALAAIILVPYFGARFGVFESLPDTPNWSSLVFPLLWSLLAFRWADTVRKKYLMGLCVIIAGTVLLYGVATDSDGVFFALFSLTAFACALAVAFSGMLKEQKRKAADS